MAIQSAFWLPGQQGQWLQPLSIPSTASGLALRRAGPTPGTRRALLGTASHGDKRCLGSWQSRELRAGVRAGAHHSSGPRPCSPASQGLSWQREGLLASILAAWTRPPSAGRCIRLGHEHGCEGGEPGMGGGSPAQGDTLYPCWSARWVCRPKISTSPSRRRGDGVEGGAAVTCPKSHLCLVQTQAFLATGGFQAPCGQPQPRLSHRLAMVSNGTITWLQGAQRYDDTCWDCPSPVSTQLFPERCAHCVHVRGPLLTVATMGGRSRLGTWLVTGLSSLHYICLPWAKGDSGPQGVKAGTLPSVWIST